MKVIAGGQPKSPSLRPTGDSGFNSMSWFMRTLKTLEYSSLKTEELIKSPEASILTTDEYNNSPFGLYFLYIYIVFLLTHLSLLLSVCLCLPLSPIGVSSYILRFCFLICLHGYVAICISSEV